VISTVTTLTLTAVSNITIASTLALIGILVLLVLLIQKELTIAVASPPTCLYSRSFNIAIAPLLIAFALIVLSRLSEVL